MAPVGSDPANDAARGRALEAMREPLTGYLRRRVRQQDEVHDLVQEVFLRVASRKDGAPIESLRGYVFQVAASVLADRHRRRTVRQADDHVGADDQRLETNEPGPDRIVEGREALRNALAVLDRLPERTRTVFVLRRLEAMPYRDIATRLGISVSAVEKHMLRAAEQLGRGRSAP